MELTLRPGSVCGLFTSGGVSNGYQVSNLFGIAGSEGLRVLPRWPYFQKRIIVHSAFCMRPDSLVLRESSKSLGGAKPLLPTQLNRLRPILTPLPNSPCHCGFPSTHPHFCLSTPLPTSQPSDQLLELAQLRHRWGHLSAPGCSAHPPPSAAGLWAFQRPKQGEGDRRGEEQVLPGQAQVLASSHHQPVLEN